MSKRAKQALVPELRFPEFRKEGEWKEEPFSELYSFIVTNSLSRDKLNYSEGAVKNIHYGDIHTKFATLFDVTKEKVPYINADVPLGGYGKESYCAEGDMVFADASEDQEGVGKGIEVYKLNKERVLSGLHTLHARQLNKKLTRGFGGYLFLSDRIRVQIKREAQGAKVVSISGPRLSNVQVCYPSSKDEQQKIAACLSTLDALLAAEREKLEALRAHKKGLMQELFPAEGAKVPALRFPGFGGEWEEKLIGDVCNTFSGGTPLTSRSEYYGGEIPFIRSAEIGAKKTELFLTELGLNSSSAKLVNKGDVLFAMYGANSGDVAIAQLDGAINQAILCIQSRTSNEYIYHYLTLKKQWIVTKYVQGGQGNLSGEAVRGIVVPFPHPDEQKEIARCLSSLDDRIALQEDRIESIEQHKKGLMQGLFPPAN